MKKFDFFLTSFVCTAALSLYAEITDKKICAKDYFPSQEATAPSLANEANPDPTPNPSDPNSSSDLPITPPEPSTDKQYVPTSTNAPK